MKGRMGKTRGGNIRRNHSQTINSDFSNIDKNFYPRLKVKYGNQDHLPQFKAADRVKKSFRYDPRKDPGAPSSVYDSLNAAELSTVGTILILKGSLLLGPLTLVAGLAYAYRYLDNYVLENNEDFQDLGSQNTSDLEKLGEEILNGTPKILSEYFIEKYKFLNDSISAEYNYDNYRNICKPIDFQRTKPKSLGPRAQNKPRSYREGGRPSSRGSRTNNESRSGELEGRRDQGGSYHKPEHPTF